MNCVKDSVKLDIRSELCGDAQLFGAFPEGDVLSFRLTADRYAGVFCPTVSFRNDEGCCGSLRLSFIGTDRGKEEYYAEKRLEKTGLYRYDVFCDTAGGVIYAARDVQLTVYSRDFKTPEWIKGGVMYQIFVDRFARGGRVKKRSDAVMIDDWDNGEPEYPHVRGGHLENNTFFGGTLYGVADKLGYLSSLGVNCIYLCPVFEAYSNHKYDTGDYSKIDEMFGGGKAFDALLKKADEYGIRIVLDGVFNHTGADSVYFNKTGRYGAGGAYNDPSSPYYSWYNFREWPDDYECWWNIPILPRVKSDDPSYREYMLGADGIVRKYIKRGVSGWRLDVADELSDGFLDALRRSVKDEDPEAIIYGEVWEDASNKISYGNRRRYLQGGQLDGVMNYVFRSAVISFLRDRDAAPFASAVTDVYHNYPKCVSDAAMNILGTHDTARILNVLSAPYPDGASNDELCAYRLTDEQKRAGKSLLKIAWLICSTVPGVPCIFYGDEAGMEGWGDPFCRRTYPWGREDGELLEYYKSVGSFRRSRSVYKDGIFRVVHADGGALIFSRGTGKEALYTAVNVGDKEFDLGRSYTDAFSGKTVKILSPMTATVLHK